ncbi:MAG: phosphomannomutase/phosphoglucomutase [Marinagarivorans sp.]|nr:phosphomannomutase/phosphoglucomutase [Marinagarivorans sp.]
MNKNTNSSNSLRDITPVKLCLSITLSTSLLICSIVTYFLWNDLVVYERQHQLAEFTDQNLKKSTDNISANFLAINKKVAFFGQSSQLFEALKAEDSVELRQIRLNIMNSFQHAEGVRLTPLNKAKLNLDAALPLRFSELEMIKATETRKVVEPEAVHLAQGWRLNFALPIPTDASQPVAGTLLITATLDDTFAAMTEGLENIGKFTLFQKYTGGQHQLYSAGSGNFLPAQTREVPGTPWVVEYTASENILKGVQTNWVIFSIATSITWLLGIAIGFGLGLFIGNSAERKRRIIEKTYRRMGQTTPEEIAGSSYASLNADILDIRVEDEDLLGFEDEPPPTHNALVVADEAPVKVVHKVAPEIFRAYDIRGLAGSQITNEVAHLIGQALASEALDLGEDTLIVGRDARTHSPIFTEYLVRGILSTGCNVINIGTVATPIVYFAVETLDGSKSGVVVTASHNGPEYNGFKCIMNGRVRSEADIQMVRQRIEGGRFYVGHGEERRHDISADYIDTILADVALAGDISVVIDAGNGVTGKIAPKLFEEIGCEVTAINCDLDGSFPNHGPDPTQPANLVQLINKVTEVGADMGIAFDGDGDRIVVVTGSGKIIWPDRLLMLFAKDILSRNPGADVVYDVKCTRSINRVVTQFGGRPIMWKTGHAPMKEKIQEAGALLGGEYSGHIFIKERWFGFDDGMYVGARLAEIVSLAGESLDSLFEEFPELPHTNEILVSCDDKMKFDVIKRLTEEGEFKEAKITTLDGIRVDFPQGWGIVRASNTSPNLTLRAEANTNADLHDIKALLTRELRKIDQALTPKW